MPSLNWIGKEAVTNHDKEVPFRLLKKVKTASVGDESQNLIEDELERARTSKLSSHIRQNPTNCEVSSLGLRG
jgi:hypothetical protein